MFYTITVTDTNPTKLTGLQQKLKSFKDTEYKIDLDTITTDSKKVFEVISKSGVTYQLKKDSTVIMEVSKIDNTSIVKVEPKKPTVKKEKPTETKENVFVAAVIREMTKFKNPGEFISQFTGKNKKVCTDLIEDLKTFFSGSDTEMKFDDGSKITLDEKGVNKVRKFLAA